MYVPSGNIPRGWIVVERESTTRVNWKPLLNLLNLSDQRVCSKLLILYLYMIMCRQY